MSRHQSHRLGNAEAQGAISPPRDISLASAHAEAARQHAAAADVHALAAELHYEARLPDECFDLISKQEAVGTSADALTQTGTSAEASELAGVDLVIVRDALRIAHEASRLADDGGDPRRAHAQAAKSHAALADQHARSAQTTAPQSQEAQEAAFDAEAACVRARDAGGGGQAGLVKV